MSNYKSPIRIVNTDFRAGEIDPLLSMRGDTGGLPSSAVSLNNMLISQNGPVSRRPGSRNLAKLPSACRLLEFDFDVNEKYIVALYTSGLKIYYPDGTLLVTLAGPWSASTTVWELTYVQKGDVMIIVHPLFQMRRLRRTSINAFVLETLTFGTDTGVNVLNQPYFKYAPRDHRIKVSSIDVGAATVSAESPIFAASWIGERIRIFDCEMLITSYTTPQTIGVTVKQPIKAELGIAPLRYYDGMGYVDVTHPLHGLDGSAHVTLSGATEWPGIDRTHINTNMAISVIDEDHYRVFTSATATESGDGGGPGVFVSTTDYTRNWKEQTWSARHGWPGSICLHENRLWLAGSKDLPTFISGSSVGDYYDHNVRDGLDDESVQALISTSNRIVHMISAKQLQIFTEGAEAVVETQNGMPITPGAFKVLTHTSYGVSTVPPRLFDGATLFCQRNGKNIREMIYDYNSDMQISPPVSLLANHLISRPRDLAVLTGSASRPEQYAFVVNDNGSIAVFQSLRQEKLAAWSPLQAGGGGWFDSVVVIGSSVYLSVRHGGEYFLELLELDATDIWLDHAKKFSGPESATWTLGADYAGKALDVMCRNNYLGRFTADGAGTVTLPVPVPEAVVGYDYPVTIIPQPPDKEMTDGSMTGEIRRILSSTIHYHKSASATVNGQEQMMFNPFSSPADQPVLKSGKLRVRMLGYGRDPSLTISQSTPGPLTVLGLSMEVSL